MNKLDLYYYQKNIKEHIDFDEEDEDYDIIDKEDLHITKNQDIDED